MSADDRCPQWVRVSTHHMTSIAGRYVLGGKTAREWADYGRLWALTQLCACTTGGYIDAADTRRLASLAQDLGMAPKACRAWLAVLVEGGAIDREAWESRGWILVPDSFNAVQSYASQSRTNKRIAKEREERRKAGDTEHEA